MSGNAIARLQRVLARVGRNSGLLGGKYRCFLGTGSGSINNQMVRRERSAGWLTMQESGIQVSSKPAPRSKLLVDSFPPWQGICQDMKRRAGLYTPATRNGFTNTLGNGPEIFASTRNTSSVAPSERVLVSLDCPSLSSLFCEIHASSVLPARLLNSGL